MSENNKNNLNHITPLKIFAKFILIKKLYKRKLYTLSQSDKIYQRKIAVFLKKIDFNKMICSLFSYEKRPLIHRCFFLFLIVICALFVGKSLSHIVLDKSYFSHIMIDRSYLSQLKVHPVNLKGEHFQISQKLERLRDLHLFNRSLVKAPSSFKKPRSKKLDTSLCLSSRTKTHLRMSLNNTIVLQNHKKSLASLEINKKNIVLDLREGDMIDKIAQLGKIQKRKIFLRNLKTGYCEFLPLSKNFYKESDKLPSAQIHPAKDYKKLMKGHRRNIGIVNKGNEYNIKTSVRDTLLQDIDKISQQALVIPYRNSDGTLSLKTTQIVPGSLLSQIGIENGDSIVSFNGKKITQLNEVMKIYGNLSQLQHITVGVMRFGEKIEKTYNFVQ